MAELNSTDIDKLESAARRLKMYTCEIEYGKVLFAGNEVVMSQPDIDTAKNAANAELAQINADLATITPYVV